MFIVDKIALPVLLALAISTLTRAGEVRLFDQTRIDGSRNEVDVGEVSLDKTTVGELKAIAANKTGIKLDRIRLTTTKGVPMMDIEMSLSEFVSIYEDTLFVKICDDLLQPGSIHIDFGHDRTELIVKKDKTLGWLKREALKDADPSEYKVFFEGKELTDDTKTLGEYKLYRGAYVVIFKKDATFKVIVVPLVGRERHFDVTLETSVQDLEKMIEDSGVEIEDQLLVHYGKVMDKQTKLFTHSVLPFHYEFVVHMVDPISEDGDKILIFLKKPDGVAHYNLEVKPSTSLAELKEYAFKADNTIPIEKMKFRLGSLVLEGDSRTLRELNLYKGVSLLAFSSEN